MCAARSLTVQPRSSRASSIARRTNRAKACCGDSCAAPIPDRSLSALAPRAGSSFLEGSAPRGGRKRGCGRTERDRLDISWNAFAAAGNSDSPANVVPFPTMAYDSAGGGRRGSDNGGERRN
ncbi:hypothetical protein GCM10027605_08880 [Micromonospora zhanjiangensis]